MAKVGTRRLKGSVASLALLGVLLVVLLAGVPPAAAGSGSYTENFATTTYRDAGATNASGWGTGAIRLPHKTPVLLGTYDTPGHAIQVQESGGIAYVADSADGTSGLQVVNVTDPRRPTLLGSYTTPGYGHRLYVVGGVAYVIDTIAGLVILNVSNPRNPTLLGSYVPAKSGQSVYVVGSIAYVANPTAGLQVLNVSNPRNPTLLSTYATPPFARWVHVLGSIVYVACQAAGLLVLNVSNPRSPTSLGSYTTLAAWRVLVVGCIAYLGDDYEGLVMLNVSNPRSPTFLGSYSTSLGVAGMSVEGGVAYLAANSPGFLVLDVSNPRSPTLLGSYKTPNSAMGVWLAGSIACVTDYSAGLLMLSVADFTQPALVGTHDTPSWAFKVAVVGGVAYVADYEAGLQVVNVTDPRSPSLLGTYDTPGAVIGVAVVGGVAYVADGGLGLHVLNVTNPRSPVLLSTYSTPSPAWAVAVVGGVAYVADYEAGLLVVNVTDLRSPTPLGSYNTPGYTRGVAVVGGVAYVASEAAGVQVINVTNPRGPTLLGSYNTPGAAMIVAVVGGVAYVADYGAGLQVLNVTNPRQPTLLGSYNTPGAAYDVVVVGGIAYIGDEAGGLRVVNVTNPRSPVLLSNYTTTDYAAGVAVVGDYAYVADYGAGLQVVEVQRNRGRQFESLAMAQSLTVFTATAASLVRATLTSSQTLPTGTALSYYLSADAGLHWEAVTPGVEHVFANAGTELRWRAILTTSDALQTPVLSSLAITYTTQLDAPTLVTPSDDTSTNDDTPTFQWTVVTGAAGYLIQLDTVPTFNSLNLRNATVMGGAMTTYVPTLPLVDGTWYWRVAANDFDGDLGFFSTTWHLHLDATSPIWDEPPTSQVVEFPSWFRYDVNASDPSGVAYYWLNDTTHFAIDGNGVITNATALPMDIYWLEVRAYDPYDNFCSATFTVTVQDTQPPTWDELPTDQVLELGSGFRYDVNASDPSGVAYYWLNDTTRFTINSAGVVTNVTALPVGNYGLQVRAYDPYDHYCAVMFTVTVQDTTAPIWDQVPTDQVAEFGSGFRYDVNASDASGIAYYWLYDETYFTVDGNGVITNVTALPVGFYWVEVWAYDPYDNYRIASFSVTVQDTQPPTWDQTPTDQIVEYGNDLRYDVNATDPSGIDHYSINTSAFSVDSAGVVTNVDPLYVGEYWLEVCAYDPYGHYCYADFKVIVQDTIAPTWDQLPTNQFAELGVAFYYDVNASDLSFIADYSVNDTTHFDITPNGMISTKTVSVGVYGLEVRAYDPYGHYCAAVFTVTVRDTTPPTFSPELMDLTLPYGLGVDLALGATDLSGIDHWTVNDTVHFAISTTGRLTSIATLAAGRYGLTVTVYDPYNNGRSGTFAVTVQAETTTTTPPIPGFPWPAILLASIAAVSLGLYRRRRLFR